MRTSSCFPESGCDTWSTCPGSSWLRSLSSTRAFWLEWVWRTSAWSRTSPTSGATWESWWRFWLRWLPGCHRQTTASTGSEQSRFLGVFALAIHRFVVDCVVPVTQGTAFNRRHPGAIPRQVFSFSSWRTVPGGGSPLHHPSQAAGLQNRSDWVVCFLTPFSFSALISLIFVLCWLKVFYFCDTYVSRFRHWVQETCLLQLVTRVLCVWTKY